MFSPTDAFTKACYIAGYLFLSVISVGFGFGFYWKVLESRGEASRSAESAITQVQSALFAASTRLEQLQSTLSQLTTVSSEKAVVVERDSGKSLPQQRAGRRAAAQDARGGRGALQVRLGFRQGAHRHGQVRHGRARRRSAEDRQGRPVRDRRQDRQPQRVPAWDQPASSTSPSPASMPSAAILSSSRSASIWPTAREDHYHRRQGRRDLLPGRPAADGLARRGTAPSTSCPSCQSPRSLRWRARRPYRSPSAGSPPRSSASSPSSCRRPPTSCASCKGKRCSRSRAPGKRARQVRRCVLPFVEQAAGLAKRELCAPSGGHLR